MDNLYKILKIKQDSSLKEIKEAYSKIVEPTKEDSLAYNVLRDKYYRSLYDELEDVSFLIKAGFFTNALEPEYNLSLLTTPFGKILKNLKEDTINPVVLLSTGGFYPIHDGHIHMMELAKKELEKQNFNVVGGYFSISHDDYVLTKPNYSINKYNRIFEGQKQLEKNSWLDIDPWESIYVHSLINFTDVIMRLEQYLQRYVRKDIRVFYVFGSDNVDFMYCFENFGNGICVNRDICNNNFYEVKKELSNTCLFIENFSETKSMSSRNIRKNKKIEISDNYSDYNYIVRNEGHLSLNNFRCFKTLDELKYIQNIFLNKFIRILKEYILIPIKIYHLDEQITLAKKYLLDKKTISLDSYFKDDFNLEISRLFNISDIQNSYINLTSRIDKSFKRQVDGIPSGEYILVDDDSVSGNTIRNVKENLPKDILIKDVYLLANNNIKNIFDVIDLRDFIIGSENSGLMVLLSNNETTRVPYISPYVNLHTRANIPIDKSIEFSIKILELNKELYSFINKDITLKNVDKNFIKLMKYIGFTENKKMIDVLDWHLQNLKNM